MTKWSEFPLRPQGQPWPGLNTRGGKLDPGAGFLEDGSINAVINEADLLEKRLGFVRGLNERFSGPVCGLFRYTDNCGTEYLVVADGDGIHVRQPFAVPSFLGTDSLPFDDFEELDTSKWSPTARYEVLLGALRLKLGADDLDVRSFTPPDQLMGWFKPSVVQSYFVEVNYRLQAQVESNGVSVVIKRNGNTYLEASVVATATTYQLTLFLVLNGGRITLGGEDLGGASLADGFLTLSYDAGTFTATARVVPSGGTQASVAFTLTELQDAALGQHSAIGLQRESDEVNPEVESVSGGQL